MKHPTLCALLIAAQIFSAHAADRICDMSWMPSSEVFKSWKDFEGRMGATRNANTPKEFTLENYRLAICSADLRRSHILKLKGPKNIGLSCGGRIGPIPENQMKSLVRMGDGTFYGAFLINGIRCSNVIEFRVDATRPPLSGPSIHLVAIPDLDKDVIAQIGVWVIPPNELDPTLTNYIAAYPSLLVDGILRKVSGITWTGPIVPLSPHTSYGSIVDFDIYLPKIPPANEHDIQLIIETYNAEIRNSPTVNTYKSPLQHLTINRDMEAKFDTYFKSRSGK